MAYIYTGKLISELRKRKQWQQEKLLEKMSYYAPEMYRIEKGEQLPRADTLKLVMETLEAPLEELVCPHLDNQPMEVYILRYALIQSLDNKDLPASEKLFNELCDVGSFDSPINKQFLLSQKA
ncbi:MAG: helix-turn-helix transcriptional regulator, partial [Oscillospiraceae bacterium]|nr:helix-turn-helix transcriptional regulator [Oscillospiraceae bacterium]